jgi:methionyl-tRNA formyltransferase
MKRCLLEKRLRRAVCYLKREGAEHALWINPARGVIEALIATIVRDEPKPQPQQGEPVIFRRRRPAESDLAQAPIHDLNDFFDFIRMRDAEGYPRAFLDLHGPRMEFSRVQLEQDRLVGTFVLYRQDT